MTFLGYIYSSETSEKKEDVARTTQAVLNRLHLISNVIFSHFNHKCVLNWHKHEKIQDYRPKKKKNGNKREMNNLTFHLWFYFVKQAEKLNLHWYYSLAYLSIYRCMLLHNEHFSRRNVAHSDLRQKKSEIASVHTCKMDRGMLQLTSRTVSRRQDPISSSHFNVCACLFSVSNHSVRPKQSR